jgi:glutaminyl-tRNA synthetase
LWIEQDDFREDAPKKYFRLKLGGDVRLRGGYIIDCHDVVKDANGKVIEVLCTYDPDSRSGQDTSGRKVKGTIHWVSAEHAKEVEVRNYDRLFLSENPEDAGEGKTFLDQMNKDSLTVSRAFVEPSLADVGAGERFQFERLGYYYTDPDSRPGKPVFNRIVPLRDSWGNMESKGKAN